MLIQRAFIAFTLGPLLLYFAYLGGIIYFVAITAILVMATIEYAHLMRRFDWPVPLWLIIPSVLVQLIAGQWTQPDFSTLALAGSLFMTMCYAFLLYERDGRQDNLGGWFATMAGIILLGWIGSHFFRLRGMAWQWTILALVSSWVSDIGAYVIGTYLTRVIGRHSLIPRLSPNKTIEGYVGGILIGMGSTMLLAYFLQLPFMPSLILGFLISVFGPAGDLGISLMKRIAGVKDSGVLFPGHGGALDRIDSLIWAMAIAYYVVLFVN